MTWRESEAVSRPERHWPLVLLLWLGACDQLGNPPTYSTGPTKWTDGNGQLQTITRSFRDENTIRRIASEGFEDFDYVDASIGPSQTLTIVTVAPRKLRVTGRSVVTLTTTFQLESREGIVRRWTASASKNRWVAAFALPAPPVGAVTSVVP